MPTPPFSFATMPPTPDTAPKTVADALAVLRDLGVADVSAGPDAAAPLTGVAPDTSAGAGDLSWIASSALAAEPGRATAFGGTLLISPPGGTLSTGSWSEPTTTVSRATFYTAITDQPRLVFSRLVAALFPDRLRTRWTDGVAPDAEIHPGAVLASSVVVGPGVVIADGATVGPNTVLMHTTLGRGVAVGANCTLGADGFGYTRDPETHELVPFPHLGRVVLADGVTVGANTCIDRGALGETRIGARTRIDNLVHIAHNVSIGTDCAVIARAMIAGSVTVGDRAWIAPSASILNQRTVGADAVVGLGAVVIHDVPPGATVVGNPARELSPRT